MISSLEIFLVFLFGLIIGSFINVIIYRLPKGISIIFPSSHCPKCERKLKWYHNIPVISFILLRGKCAFCGEKISLQYPLVELLSAFLLLCLYFRFNPFKDIILFLFVAYFTFSLLCISVIDFKQKEIPDSLSFPLIFAGWFFCLLGKNPFQLTIIDSLISSFAGIGLLFFINELYYVITKRDSIGIGDFKLMGGIGSFLGVQSFFSVLFYASLFGVITFFLFVIYKKFFKKEEILALREALKEEIPFGPFLSLGALLYLFNFRILL